MDIGSLNHQLSATTWSYRPTDRSSQMFSPNPRRQRQARAMLERLFAEAADVWVIHCSCESFYDRPDGRSPRITSIAVRKLDSGQTTSFSIHQVAERQGVPFDRIDQAYDALERSMLDEFFQLVGAHRDMRYLHWNMRDQRCAVAMLGPTASFVM